MIGELIPSSPFYEGLSQKDIAVVQNAEKVIRIAGRAAVRAMYSAGKQLAIVKPILTANGMWRRWLKDNFECAHDTADRYIQVAQRFANVDAIAEHFDKTALYLLSDDNTPQVARDAALDLAEKGEHINKKVATEIFEAAQKAAANVVQEIAVSNGYLALDKHSVPMAVDTVEVTQEDGTTISQVIAPTPQTAKAVQAAVTREIAEILQADKERIVRHIEKRAEKLGKIQFVGSGSLDMTELQAMLDAARLDGYTGEFFFSLWGFE